MTFPIVALGDVAETALGKMLDKAKTKGHRHAPYLRNVNVQWGRIDTDDLLTMELADDERERFAVREGDLLVCEGGDIGRCAIWQGRSEYLAYQKALHRIRPSDKLDTLYLRYLLEHHSLSGQLAKLATGTTIAHLPQQQLRRVPVPLPPVDEQRRIVNVLEDHLSRLDAATAYLIAARRRLDVLRKRAFLFAKDVKSNPMRLSDVLDCSIGGVWGSDPGVDEVDVRVLRVTELKAWGRVEPSTAATRSITRKQLESRRLRTGDLLLEKSGGGPRTPVGRVGIVGELDYESVCANFMQLLRPKPDLVRPIFLHLALNAFHLSGGTEAMQTASTNIRNIKASDYVEIDVAIPDLSVQDRVVAEARALLEEADRVAAEATLASKRSVALRRAVLAAAFSGALSGAASKRSETQFGAPNRSHTENGSNDYLA